MTEKRLKHKIIIPKEIDKIFKIFQDNSFKLFIVGGAVRDTLLGKPIKDFDLATDAQPSDVERILNLNGMKTIGTGVQFGVINVFVNGVEFEIATFREDSTGSDGRRPDSVTFSDISTDVMRRDLTINALFYDISTSEIVDLVGGIDDLKNGVVRAVGDAKNRFDEDRLRILRAIRFAGRLGSDLDSDIRTAIMDDNSLSKVSGERIRDEFVKGIKSAKSTKHFLSLIDEFGLFDSILSGFNSLNKDFIESNDEIIVLCKLLSQEPHNIIAKKLNSLKYSSDEIKKIVFAIKFLQTFNEDNFYDLKKAHRISKLSDETFIKIGDVLDINEILIENFINFELTVSGQFVMNEFNIDSGPKLGDKIKELETESFFG